MVDTKTIQCCFTSIKT